MVHRNSLKHSFHNCLFEISQNKIFKHTRACTPIKFKITVKSLYKGIKYLNRYTVL